MCVCVCVYSLARSIGFLEFRTRGRWWHTILGTLPSQLPGWRKPLIFLSVVQGCLVLDFIRREHDSCCISFPRKIENNIVCLMALFTRSAHSRQFCTNGKNLAGLLLLFLQIYPSRRVIKYWFTVCSSEILKRTKRNNLLFASIELHLVKTRFIAFIPYFSLLSTTVIAFLP